MGRKWDEGVWPPNVVLRGRVAFEYQRNASRALRDGAAALIAKRIDLVESGT